MSETIITVTEAARNFADCVNRSHYQKTTFVLLKNGVPFARNDAVATFNKRHFSLVPDLKVVEPS